MSKKLNYFSNSLSLGNKSSKIEFETLSGTLIARRDGDKIVLDFPSNPPAKLTGEQARALQPLVNKVVGKLPVEEILLSPRAKKLLVRLKDTCSRFV